MKRYIFSILLTGLIFYDLFSFSDFTNDLQTIITKADECSFSLKYESAEPLYAEALMLLNKEKNPELYCSLLNKHTASLFWQDKLNYFEKYYWEGFKTCLQLLGINHPETARAMINLGAFKFVAGGQGVVPEYFKEAAWILEKNYGLHYPDVAKAYEWLGTYYESVADTVMAKKYLFKSFNLWKKIRGENHADLAEIYRYLGLYYKRFYKHDSALLMFSKAKDLFDHKYGSANFQSVKCLNNMADIYSERDFSEPYMDSIYNYCEALLNQSSTHNRMALAMTYYNRAEYKNNIGKYHDALVEMNKLLKLYFPDFKIEDIYGNPKNSKGYTHWIPHLVALFKAQTFELLSHKNPEKRIKYLKAAQDNYTFSDKLIQEMRLFMINLEDVINISNRYAKINETKARTNIEIFQYTNDTAYISSALNYISSINLSEHINRSKSFFWNSFNITRETILNFELFNKELNDLQNKILSFPNDTSIVHNKNRITIKQELFMWDFVKGNKSIVRNCIKTDRFSLSDIQKNIKKDESILILAEHKDECNQLPGHLTIIAINKKEVKVNLIPGNEFFKLIKQYQKDLANNISYKTITKSGYEIYKIALKPIEDVFKEKIGIIPSAHTNLLSFESLPYFVDPEYRQTKLMIEKHTIWKMFSINDLLKEKQNEDFYSDSLLAIAPQFNKDKIKEISLLAQRDSRLINLVGTLVECSEIAQNTKTRLISGFSATEGIFKSICMDYPMIHISTHGVPEKTENTSVRLAFSKEDLNNDGWLNFYEILNLNLNANLVVLSACKTGIGKVNNGLGNLNLAWAFKQAGAASTIIGLWDVNDYASSKIMPAFYANLEKGYSKPDALRQAKLNFIKNSDVATSNPYYWAAFDYFGPYESKKGNVSMKKNFKFLALFTTLSIAVIILLLVVKNRYRH